MSFRMLNSGNLTCVCIGVTDKFNDEWRLQEKCINLLYIVKHKSLVKVLDMIYTNSS